MCLGLGLEPMGAKAALSGETWGSGGLFPVLPPSRPIRGIDTCGGPLNLTGQRIYFRRNSSGTQPLPFRRLSLGVLGTRSNAACRAEPSVLAVSFYYGRSLRISGDKPWPAFLTYEGSSWLHRSRTALALAGGRIISDRSDEIIVCAGPVSTCLVRLELPRSGKGCIKMRGATRAATIPPYVNTHMHQLPGTEFLMESVAINLSVTFRDPDMLSPMISPNACNRRSQFLPCCMLGLV